MCQCGLETRCCPCMQPRVLRTPQMKEMLAEMDPGSDKIPQNRNQLPRPAKVYRNMLQ